jgi:hypothetical protein
VRLLSRFPNQLNGGGGGLVCAVRVGKRTLLPPPQSFPPPKTFRGNVDDKHALINETEAIPEKGVGGSFACLANLDKFEDHLTLVLRD